MTNLAIDAQIAAWTAKSCSELCREQGGERRAAFQRHGRLALLRLERQPRLGLALDAGERSRLRLGQGNPSGANIALTIRPALSLLLWTLSDLRVCGLRLYKKCLQKRSSASCPSG